MKRTITLYLSLVIAWSMAFPFSAFTQQKSPLNIISTIPSPTNSTNDITFDGTHLFVGGYDYKIYKILPSGTVIDTLSTPIKRPYGLTIVNGKLWVADNFTKTIHRINKISGVSETSFTSPCTAYDAGLAWDGAYFWHTDAQTKNLYKLDTTGVVKQTLITPLQEPTGLTYDGSHLWIGDNYTNKLYRYNPNTFKYVDTVASPKDRPNGLAFDGQYIWVAENESTIGADQIFQIDVGITPSNINTQHSERIVSISPNPSNGVFHVSTQGFSSESRLNIYDITGREIYSTSIQSPLFTLDLSNQTKGVYFCRMETEGQVITRKLVMR